MSYGEDEPPPPWQGSSRRANGPRQQGAPRARRQGSGRAPDLGAYVEVKDRIRAFYERYPQGRIQSEVIAGLSHIQGIETVEVTKTNADGSSRTQEESVAVGYVAVKAYAYRTPDDPLPATGMSAMLMPGTTPYTRGSELENAETSAWGRALANLDILNDRGIASRDEVSKASGQDEDDVAAAAYEAAQAGLSTSPVTAAPPAPEQTPPAPVDDMTAAAAAILGAVPVEDSSGAASRKSSGPQGPETPTDAPAAPEGDGRAPVGLGEAEFLDGVRAAFVHSSIVNKVRIAMFPDSKSYRDLTDAQRAALLDGCIESTRKDTKG